MRESSRSGVLGDQRRHRETGREKRKGRLCLARTPRWRVHFRRRYGRVVSNADIRSLSRGERRHLCELDFETSAILLPPGCYLNHSCDPNAMRSGVKVFAWRSIRPGEEITIDYRLNAFGGQRSTCVCGSLNCSGEIISDFFSIEAARQMRYLPYAPDFIRREYRRRLKPAPGVGGRLRPGASSPD